MHRHKERKNSKHTFEHIRVVSEPQTGDRLLPVQRSKVGAECLALESKPVIPWNMIREHVSCGFPVD